MDKDYYGSSDSGTDHAQFLQYYDRQGRWMSPDPYSGSYDFSNPQSMNRYSYVMNNPLTFTDPSGQMTGLGGYIGTSICGLPCGFIGLGIDGLVGWAISDLFGGHPSFHGSLQPRPSTPSGPASFGENLGLPTSMPQGNWGLSLALNLPSEGCDFGPCGDGESDFVPGAGAIAGTIACEFAEPCGAFEDIALLAGTAGVLGYDIYLMGRKQSNEWTDAAKQFAPQDPCGWLAQQLNKPENGDSATQRKIVQAQKFLGCRNVNKRNQ